MKTIQELLDEQVLAETYFDWPKFMKLQLEIEERTKNV